MRLLDRINQIGTTVLMATHDQRIVNSMRKRVIQLDRGVIVARPGSAGYEERDPACERRAMGLGAAPEWTYVLRETWASFRRNVTLTAGCGDHHVGRRPAHLRSHALRPEGFRQHRGAARAASR